MGVNTVTIPLIETFGKFNVNFVPYILKKNDIHDTITVNKTDGLHQHNKGIKY